KTGLYVGYTYPFGGDYQSFINAVDPQLSSFAVPGNIKALIASRISYILDLKGPAMLIDTACSSSLVAVHLACQAIRNGECDQAIAGGINIAYFTLTNGEGFGIESSNGRTRTFDDGSDGTGSGEGTAAVFLKPLSRAIKDRDSIYAVIKGSCINQDGSSVGITAPNTKAQEELILSAWKDAGIDPETISYIEAHGTGTKLGDPIEIDGISRAFRKHTSKKQFCAIGSAKTNVGHLNSAAGITGFIKAVVALKHQEIPPSIHFQQPNRKIDFENSPVYVNDKLRKWETNGFPRRCGVSAFGLSGTNCHIILEEARVLPGGLARTRAQMDEPKLQVLALSAKSRYSMVFLIKSYQAYLERAGAIQINDLCYTANTGRGHYNYRLAIICKDLPDLQAKLQKLIGGNTHNITDPHLFYGEHAIIAANKKQIEPGDILEEEKKQLDNLALVTIQQITANDQAEKLVDLCRLYIRGAEIKWEELADLRQVSTVNLPVYPFERKRCWLEVPEITAVKDENLYHAVNWKREALISSEVEILENKNILIFHGEDGTGAELAQRLSSAGSRIIEVKTGSGFGRETENSYTIGLKAEDYDELWREIKSRNISAIIHTMACGAGPTNINNLASLEELLQRGVYSLYHLVRALHKNRIKERLNIFLIAKYAHEVTQKEAVLYPENAAFFGLGKVIAQEYPNLNCRCIDIDNEECSNLILRELQLKTGPYVTAFRERERYQEIIEKVDFHEVKEEAITIKEQGVYLITGGTGGIGLELGRYLAAQKKVNLVLMNRHGMPERGVWDSILSENKSSKMIPKIKCIRNIEAMGSQVILYRVDVSDEEAMKFIIHE
ncbi:MAG TPA: beta-ketoacyl synthase N-terminal-like domain-containing protein, partial [Bacillota bacterium]|nr:beta-ketoacyl synthase N-terminal-like domain-containing protein [Bacillota bacterium]